MSARQWKPELGATRSILGSLCASLCGHGILIVSMGLLFLGAERRTIHQHQRTRICSAAAPEAMELAEPEEEIPKVEPPEPDAPRLDAAEVVEQELLEQEVQAAQAPEVREPPPRDLLEPVHWPRAFQLLQNDVAAAAESSPPTLLSSEPDPEALVDEAPGDQEPVLLDAPAPQYPPAAKRYGWEGAVVCRILVRSDGTVGQVRVLTSSGHTSLDEAALDAIRGWRFKPGLRAGRGAEFEVLHRVSFRLNRT